MSRLLHTGDWHVGSGIDYGAAPGDRLIDQEANLKGIVDVAIEWEVDAVVIGGDIWHRRRPTPAEMMAVARPLARLRAQGIEVLSISGNHDVESPDLPTGMELFDEISGPLGNVHRQPGVWHAPGGVAVVTLPWTPVGRLVAAQGGGDRSVIHREAAELLVNVARGYRAEITGPAVLTLHYAVAGGKTPTGADVSDFQEVVLPLEELAGLGYQAVGCSHIHLPMILHGGIHGHSGPVFQSGSPDVVDFGEADSKHGVWILDVDPGDTAARVEFVEIDHRPFVTLFADFTDGEDLLAEIGFMRWEGNDALRDAVVRVRYRCTEDQAHLIDREKITRMLLDQGAHKVYAFEPTILRANRARLEAVSDEQLSPLAAAALWAEAQGLQEWERESLNALTTTYLERVA